MLHDSEHWQIVATLLLFGAVLGGLFLALLEMRLRAMRELFKLAIIQRESFDTVAGSLHNRLRAVEEGRLPKVESALQELAGKVTALEHPSLKT